MNHGHSESAGNDRDKFGDEPVAVIGSDFFRNGFFLAVVVVQMHEKIPDDFPEFQNLRLSFAFSTSEDGFGKEEIVVTVIIITIILEEERFAIHEESRHQGVMKASASLDQNEEKRGVIDEGVQQSAVDLCLGKMVNRAQTFETKCGPRALEVLKESGRALVVGVGRSEVGAVDQKFGPRRIRDDFDEGHKNFLAERLKQRLRKLEELLARFVFVRLALLRSVFRDGGSDAVTENAVAVLGIVHSLRAEFDDAEGGRCAIEGIGEGDDEILRIRV